MRCHCCDSPGQNIFDDRTGRYYCRDCSSVITLTGFDNNEEDFAYTSILTSGATRDILDVDTLVREAGIDVTGNSSDMS